MKAKDPAKTTMTTALKAIDGSADLPALMTGLAKGARAAARVLALAPTEQKNRALEAIERAIRANAAKILAANAEDVGDVPRGAALDLLGIVGVIGHEAAANLVGVRAAHDHGIAGRAEMIHRDDLVVGPVGTVPAK